MLRIEQYGTKLYTRRIFPIGWESCYNKLIVYHILIADFDVIANIEVMKESILVTFYKNSMSGVFVTGHLQIEPVDLLKHLN